MKSVITVIAMPLAATLINSGLVLLLIVGIYFWQESISPLEIIVPAEITADAGTTKRIQLEAKGGIPPYNWHREKSTLPNQPYLQKDGRIFWTPTKDSSDNEFEVVVDDTTGRTAKTTITISVKKR